LVLADEALLDFIPPLVFDHLHIFPFDKESAWNLLASMMLSCASELKGSMNFFGWMKLPLSYLDFYRA